MLPSVIVLPFSSSEGLKRTFQNTRKHPACHIL
jgi:hypothetical protein